ncbi:MAG: hypothetical protein MUE65_03220 [Methanomassiliicoccales archaeon]|nr:hypothetical protein [Methanomassiliicoccales archaeon]
MGERTAAGSGVVVSPGCIVGADCRIGDLAVVSRNLNDRSIVV